MVVSHLVRPLTPTWEAVMELYYLIIYKALLSLYYSGDFFFFFGGNFAVLSLNNGSILNENIFFYHCWAIGYPTRRYEGVLLALNLKRKKSKVFKLICLSYEFLS